MTHAANASLQRAGYDEATQMLPGKLAKLIQNSYFLTNQQHRLKPSQTP